MKMRARTVVTIATAALLAPTISFAIIAAPFVHRAHAAQSQHVARNAEPIAIEREPSLALDAERASATDPGPRSEPPPAQPTPSSSPTTVQARGASKASAPTGPTFDPVGAQASLAASAESLPICSRGEVSGPGVAEVSWDPSGQVTRVAVSAPYAGTQIGACVARRFSHASVNPFDGPAVSTRVRFAL